MSHPRPHLADRSGWKGPFRGFFSWRTYACVLRGSNHRSLAAVSLKQLRQTNTPQKHALIVLLSAGELRTSTLMAGTGKSKTCVWRWQERSCAKAQMGCGATPAGQSAALTLVPGRLRGHPLEAAQKSGAITGLPLVAGGPSNCPLYVASCPCGCVAPRDPRRKFIGAGLTCDIGYPRAQNLLHAMCRPSNRL